MGDARAAADEQGRRGEVRLINGDPIRLLPAFAHAEPLGAEWEAPVYRRFKEALGDGMTVLDVGASFGLYSLAAARAVGPSGSVFAFEPAEATASALRLHLSWNGLADRVDVIEAAVADHDGRETFWEQETSFLASLLELAPREEEHRFPARVKRRRVRAVALDDFCEARDLDPEVLKVDVEGGEARVLRGARRLLRRRRAVLFLEVHYGLLERAGGSTDEVFGELERAGWAWEEVHAEPAGTRHYVCRPL